MKTREEVTTKTIYTSERHPEMETTDAYLAKAIAWGDANPKAWKIVMGNKSAVFGRDASTYIACSRGPSPTATIDRLAYLHATIMEDDRSFFTTWRAQFVLTHYGKQGFRGGLFQQFDGTYDRGCAYLDFTPETRDAVIARFLEWCDVGYKFPTASVKIDGKVVREMASAPAMRVRRAAAR